MKLLTIVLFFLGIIMTIIGYYRSQSNCPKQKTIYKFTPRTLEEEQVQGNPNLVKLFKGMFQDRNIL